MEVFDSDEEHLTTVLPNETVQELDETWNESPAAWEAPTAAALMASTSAAAPARNNEAGQFDFPATNKSRVLETDMDSSMERDQFLPAYAQRNFVSSHASCAAEGAEASRQPDTLDDLESDFPSNLLTPPTLRMRQVIRLTAMKSALAPQFEVLLKVRQAGNEEFAFLDAHHSYHSYYEWLKRRKRLTCVVATASRDLAKEGGGMGGLLDIYSSSSDDDEKISDSDEQKSAKSVDADQSSCPNVTIGNPTQTSEECSTKRAADKECKAKRLKRAKLLSGHFKLQLLNSE